MSSPENLDNPATAGGDLDCDPAARIDDIGAADPGDPADDIPTTERVEQDRPDVA